jgi:hypothetical protein
MERREVWAMSHSALTEINIEISAVDATEEDIDLMTRQLLSELRETEIESARLAQAGEVPLGTKSGDAITVGSIVISALPTVLPTIIGLVQGWVSRGHGRTVKFRGQIGGGMIEFEGSPQELHKLILSLESRSLIRDGQPEEGKENLEQKSTQDSHGVGLASAKNKTTRSPKIFISYRRSDSADVTGRIYDSLTRRFGTSAVFKDVDSIPPGADYKEHLEKAVGKCKIFLVVIGEKWLYTTDSMQNNRLQDPRDFVRIEIEAALNRNILIIPLLVRGASMPAEDTLPPSLQKLVYRNAIPIRSDPDFHRDMDRLIEAISNYAKKRS